MLTKLIGAWLSISLATCQFQKQFMLPQFLRDPMYDVDFSEEPHNDLDLYPSSHIVSLNVSGEPIVCILPENLNNETSTELQPVKDEHIIAQAREALDSISGSFLQSLDDDVWAWYGFLNGSIFQALPSRTEIPGTLEVKPNSFRARIGQAGTADGYNLKTSKPVVINDRNMMMTMFENGNICDLTNAPRSCRIFFSCGEEAIEDPVIFSVSEAFPCYYEMVIGTSKLCSIPEFANSQVHPNKIRCAPKYPRVDNEQPFDEVEGEEVGWNAGSVVDEEAYEQHATPGEGQQSDMDQQVFVDQQADQHFHADLFADQVPEEHDGELFDVDGSEIVESAIHEDNLHRDVVTTTTIVKDEL